MIRPVLLIAVSSLALSGCAFLFVKGASETGAAVAGERTVGRAVDDLTIQTDLEAKLLSEDFHLFRKVDTEVVEGRVLLTGRVKTPEARATAGRIAWSIPRVQQVMNEIEVEERGQIGTYFNDLRISQQLRAKLAGDREIAFINYNVETVSGTVYLLGVAQNEQELERVTLHARTIPGVNKVESFVQLKDDPRRAVRL